MKRAESRLPNESSAEKSLRARLRKYGLTRQQYDTLFKQQQGRCAICYTTQNKWGNKPIALCIDHCHQTGVVRGLLCNFCNTEIEFLSGDKKILAVTFALSSTEEGIQSQGQSETRTARYDDQHDLIIHRPNGDSIDYKQWEITARQYLTSTDALIRNRREEARIAVLNRWRDNGAVQYGQIQSALRRCPLNKRTLWGLRNLVYEYFQVSVPEILLEEDLCKLIHEMTKTVKAVVEPAERRLHPPI
jgi:hypothetical protein